mgnify:CR=1 FL=1
MSFVAANCNRILDTVKDTACTHSEATAGAHRHRNDTAVASLQRTGPVRSSKAVYNS